MSDIGQLLARQAMMEAGRSTWEPHWRECAELMLPRQDDFFGTRRQPGEKRTAKVFDSTAGYAAQRFAAIMESILTPRTQMWHKLKPKGLGSEGGPVGEWYDAVNQSLYDHRYSPKAAFASNAHEGYMSLGVFGTAAIYCASAPGAPLWYRLCHLAEIYFAEDAWGRIDTVHRKYTMTARQVVQAFPKERVPEKVHDLAERKPEEEVCALHCTVPNKSQVSGREDAAGMPWASYYVLPEYQAMVDEGGYWSFPWAISRYVTAPREIFGRSPGMDALPDVKMLNAAAMSRAKSWHYANDPSLLIADDGVLTPVSVRPGALIAGGVDEDGRPRIIPLQNGARLDIDQAMTDQIRSGINDAFLVSLFQILVESPQMTATEVLERSREKGALLTPVMGRQHSEFLGPIIEREIDLLARANLLPPPPPEVLEMGGQYEIEYKSPLSNAARAEDALAVQRMMAQLAPLAEIQPQVFDLIDGDEVVRVTHTANGAPNRILRSEEEVDAIREQRAQQQAAQAAMQAGPAIAQTVGGLSQAAA